MRFKVWHCQDERWLCADDGDWWADWYNATPFEGMDELLNMYSFAALRSDKRIHVVPDTETAEEEEGW